MKNPKNKKLVDKAKKRSWDDLANDIIKLEKSITKQKNRKALILLENKLKILEEEKSDRLFNSFDMRFFLSKNNEEIDT